MARVRLPDGCTGLDMADGTKYSAEKQGGTVEMSASHARYLNRSWYGQSGVMTGASQFSFGTKTGRYCKPCKRSWNAWSETCPRCGGPTTPQEACGDDNDRLRNE